jgi:threonylcarbamoyladenosine tRNA methylthiotransferase MtaB
MHGSEKRFRVLTLGCRVNQYESAYLEESLQEAGWRRAEPEEAADAVVVNTCMVTGRASYQSRQAIRKQIRENPEALVVATGCYAQVSPKELAAIEGVDLVAGNSFKGRLPGFVLEGHPEGAVTVLHEPLTSDTPFDALPVRGRPGRTRALLKIQDGCSAFCSYCIVPHARGRPRSLATEAVVKALEGFSREGFLEAVLTGVHLGRYGVDLGAGSDLKALLARIRREGLPLRVRLSSLEPDEVDGELVDLVGSDPRICNHFHLAMQSGDDRVLERMKRSYTSASFADVVRTVRRRIPDAAVGADVLVGFPGESREAFERTRDLIEALPLTYLHVFRFSPRPGTPAARFPDPVPQAEAKERAAVLRQLGREKRRDFFRSRLGEVHAVLAESVAPGETSVAGGLSDNYIPFRFEACGAAVGDLVRVRAERLDGDRVAGRVEKG